MKRCILTLMALLMALAAGAQTDPAGARSFKGYLGGGVSADFSSGYSHVTLAPEIAWPVGKNLYLGSAVLAGWSNANGENLWVVGLSPYARLHAEVFAGFRIFADAGVDFRRRKYQSYQTPVYDLDLGIRPGLMIPVGNAYVLVQVGFLGVESTRIGGERHSHTGWRCESSDVRIGAYFHL